MFMKIFQKTSKIASKTQNCGKTRANWAKPLFIQVSVTPNRVESGEISHSPKSLLHRYLTPGNVFMWLFDTVW